MADDINQMTVEDMNFGDTAEAPVADNAPQETTDVPPTEGDAEGTPPPESTAQEGEKPTGEGTEEKPAEAEVSEPPGESGTQAEGETASEPGAEGSEATQEQPTETDISSALSELTEGKVKSLDEFSGIMDDYVRLLDESQKEKEPAFATDRAKNAYKFIVEQEGEFQDLTREQHRLLALDTNDMSPREIWIEAKLMESPSLSRKEFHDQFGEIYDQKKEDLSFEDADRELKIQHEVFLANGKDAIAKAQVKLQSELGESVKPGETQETAEPTQEQKDAEVAADQQREKAHQLIEQELQNFTGTKLTFGKDNKQEVNFELQAEQKQALDVVMKDPTKWLADKIEGFVQPNNAFDYNSYAQFLTSIMYQSEIAKVVNSESFKDGKIAELNTAKNVELDKVEQKPGEKSETEGFTDAFADAIAASRGGSGN